jgi:hypothetical protein
VDADEVSNSMKTFTSSVAQQPGRKQEPSAVRTRFEPRAVGVFLGFIAWFLLF